jgi:hypothetical protein
MGQEDQEIQETEEQYEEKFEESEPGWELGESSGLRLLGQRQRRNSFQNSTHDLSSIRLDITRQPSKRFPVSLSHDHRAHE